MAGSMIQQPIRTAKERLKDLAETAESLHVDHKNENLRRYFISSKQLYETAKYEAAHGNFQKAYMLIMRFLDLYVTRLPKHPFYQNVPDDLRKSTKALCMKALELGGQLKPKVLDEFEQIVRAQEEELAQRFPRSTGPGSANFDDLLHRINTLNEHNRPSAPYLESPGVSWPKVQSDQASPDEAFTNSFPGNHGPNALPLVDRRNKPRSRLPSDALREVRVPSDLVDRFAQAASENTSRKNIETCGNLWGVREHGVYVVTHVLIPKQKGTDSYCEDLDEGDVAELAISENLIQLGWIHTHPSQTAFLSSVDMHMQHGYQIMLPEAIAIVLAPKFNDVGFFRLNNYGMEMIGQCREGTNFHVHDESYPLFERIEEGVVIDGQKQTKLEDFRLR